MRKMSNEEKVALIKKFYKKNETFLELRLVNYEKVNLFICVTKTSDKRDYKLSWFDLDDIEGSDINKYISCQYIPHEVIENVKSFYSNCTVNMEQEKPLIYENDMVFLNANIVTKENETIDISFRRYLPKSMSNLMDLFIFIFKNMSKKFEGFLFEILAELTGSESKYEYKKEFVFNLFEDDINTLFEFQIVQRGINYYEEGRVKFLEKIDDRYFAIVEGNEKYLVIIKYNDEEEKMQVYCTCPCEFYCKHMYAVIMAIRNDEFNRFYKVSYRNPDKDLLERIIDFNYVLCIGVVEQNLEIINDYGEIELVPILDVHGKNNWIVIEDSEDEELTKQIKYFIDNK